MRSVLAAALVLSFLAGCVSQGVTPAATSALSPADAALKTLKEHAMTPMKDGTKLDNWVFRPDTTEKVPVIIESRPYFGNLDPTAESGGQKFSQWLISFFVPRGYAVVLHSIRGTGDSEGCYDQGGVLEQQDEAATVEDFAGMPWSNGKVAYVGKSYGGTTPWEAAVQKPPHLTTIVPIEGITNWYDYLWTNGASYQNTAFNTVYTATISYDLPPGTAPPDAQNYPGKVCDRQAELQEAGVETTATGDETAWWQERDFSKHLDAINGANISVYVVHGLQDWNVKPDQIVNVYNKLTVPKRLVLGQQDHQYPLRDDWGNDLLAWFDHFLKGKENGILATKPVRVSDSDGKWRLEDSWPPLRATPVTYDVKGGAYVDEPMSDVKDGSPGPDRIVWQSEALAAPMRLSGAPRVTFDGTFPTGVGQVAFTLFLVNATGWHPLVWAAADARHHAGPDKPDVVAPGATVKFDLQFEPLEQLVPAGAKLGLVIAGENAQVPLGPFAPQVAIAGAKLTLPTIEPNPTMESPQPTMKKPDDLPWTS
jgi:predicted acyl esterase